MKTFKQSICILIIIGVATFSSCKAPTDKPHSEWVTTSDGYAIPEKEIPDVTERAKHGDGKAAFDLSLHYSEYQEDEKQGKYWLTVAANNGYAIAQYNLGFDYEHNHNDKKNALIWYQKAAKQGDTVAIDRIAELDKLPHN